MKNDSEFAAMNVLRRAIDGATARTVFGEPVTHDGVMVIPVARVLSAGGGGGGGGGSTKPRRPDDGEGSGVGSGLGPGMGPGMGAASDLDLPAGLEDTGDGLSDVDTSLDDLAFGANGAATGVDRAAGGTGAGLALAAHPMGVYVVRHGKVTWRPAVDVNKVILGGQIVGVVALITLRAFIRAAERRRDGGRMGQAAAASRDTATPATRGRLGGLRAPRLPAVAGRCARMARRARRAC